MSQRAEEVVHMTVGGIPAFLLAGSTTVVENVAPGTDMGSRKFASSTEIKSFCHIFPLSYLSTIRKFFLVRGKKTSVYYYTEREEISYHILYNRIKL
jgi:hypothetical protein